jgi:O-antigen/teichoic acid export membrane protein
LIGASFYPALSRFSKDSKEKLQQAWNHELEIMIALAIPLVVGGILLAAPLILLLYSSEFTPSIFAFQILIVSAGFVFLYRPLYDAMIVLDQQRKTFWITIAGALLNVFLNFILIPLYSLYGAAIATVATHAIVFLSFLFFIPLFTFLRFSVSRLLLTFAISVLAALVMYVGIKQLLLINLPIFFLIPLGVVLYGAAFFSARTYIVLKLFKQVYA